jgi:hypothetical protein
MYTAKILLILQSAFLLFTCATESDGCDGVGVLIYSHKKEEWHFLKIILQFEFFSKFPLNPNGFLFHLMKPEIILHEKFLFELEPVSEPKRRYFLVGEAAYCSDKELRFNNEFFQRAIVGSRRLILRVFSHTDCIKQIPPDLKLRINLLEMANDCESLHASNCQWFCRFDLKKDRLLNILRFYKMTLSDRRNEPFQLIENFDSTGEVRSIYVFPNGGLLRDDFKE